MGRTGQRKQDLRRPLGGSKRKWVSKGLSKGWVRKKMRTSPCCDLGKLVRNLVLLRVRTVMGAFWAAKHAHGYKYSMSLGSRPTVMPRAGDTMMNVKQSSPPGNSQFIGEFGPWCHLIKGHGVLRASVVEKASGWPKVLDVGRSLITYFQEYKEDDPSLIFRGQSHPNLYRVPSRNNICQGGFATLKSLKYIDRHSRYISCTKIRWSSMEGECSSPYQLPCPRELSLGSLFWISFEWEKGRESASD